MKYIGDKSMDVKCKSCNLKCYISTEEIIHSRRCFMTDEYCSKQPKIQRKRQELHEKNCITAFVIMNFSDMSDVVYKWRLQDLIKALKKYLYIDKVYKRIYCYADYKKEKQGNLVKVDKIEMIRSDTDPSTNYVICNRICQQMQIADVVLVDVSNQNPNVFYELGMAVALGKLILPICYSESYYKRVLPDSIKETDDDYTQIEHHIGCYPWRKNLFEYYGIRYKRYSEPDKEESSLRTKYVQFDKVKNIKYGFEDLKYARFPYHEELSVDDSTKKPVGEMIYEKLRDEYNKATVQHNTLVVYTMEGFLNAEQAGRCIVNFYNNIVFKMREEQCFEGERVGVLVQENKIPENDKDSKKQLYLSYSVGEIIHIGVNEATYAILERKMTTEDVLEMPSFLKYRMEKQDELEKIKEIQKEEILRFVKRHIGNRGMLIYPNNPVYVSRIRNEFQKDILNNAGMDSENEKSDENSAFCLYHIMLKTLNYTNEIVVDISNNCLQALFWLGAAHASDTYAITVLHEETDTEREIITGTPEKKNRNIFDVAGLWTAIFQSHDIEGFYKQLILAQRGIEKRSKLMVDSREEYEKQIQQYLLLSNHKYDPQKISDLYLAEREKEKKAMESYYRNRFWKSILQYNKLHIYLPLLNQVTASNSNWDFKAVSALSHYLSKRTVIGEYIIESLEDVDAENRQLDKNVSRELNFICVGKSAEPLGKSLSQYIKNFIIEYNTEYKYNQLHEFYRQEAEDFELKGFEYVWNEKEGIFAQHPQINTTLSDKKLQYDTNVAENNLLYKKEFDLDCYKFGSMEHIQIAQLLLWRDDFSEEHKNSLFRVDIIGTSGPATYALSSIFVDNEQKCEIFKTNTESKKKYSDNLLYKMQSDVRKIFMNIFLKRLEKKISDLKLKTVGEVNDEKQLIERYINLILYAVSTYLSTVLYRYFLPFITKKDIHRIYNGMYTFVNFMKAENISPFALKYRKNEEQYSSQAIESKGVEKVIETILQVLQEVLQNFRGLEVFYLVKVQHSSNAKDDRCVLDMEVLNTNKVNCLFIPFKD